MTLMVANATYEDLGSSGMMEYFDSGQSARTCITNRCDTAACLHFVCRSAGAFSIGCEDSCVLH